MNTLIISNLKKQINEKHNVLNEGLKKSVKLAIQIGDLLTQAKEESGHGNFMEWVSMNCNFHHNTAMNYLKLYSHKTKITNVVNLSEAYKIVHQIEYKKKNIEQHNKNKVDMKKVKANIDDYKDDTKWQETKAKCFDDKETTNASDLLTDDLIDNLKQQTEDEKQFMNKITNANKHQDTFFNAIKTYLNELQDDKERLEACNNILKYVKRIAVKYQQESIA